MVALTRNDINKIIYKFDEVHFPEAVRSQNSNETIPERAVRENRRINLLERGLDKELDEAVARINAAKALKGMKDPKDRYFLPPDILSSMVQLDLMASPSVRRLLTCYQSSLHPNDKTPKITQNPRRLEEASKALLQHMRIEPTQATAELACFKQLMTLVFVHYFNKLSLPQQIEMIKKIQGSTWRIQQNVLPQGKNLSEKLAQLKSTLVVDQGRWSKAKVELQLISWKVQAFVARVLDSIFFMIAMGAGSLYGGVRLLIWFRDFKEKLPMLFEKFLEAMGVDVHAKRGPTLKEIGSGLLGLAAVIASIVFALRLGENFLQAYCPELLHVLKRQNWSDPGQIIGNVMVTVFYSGQMLANRVARSMDQAALEASQRKYIQDKTPSLIENWHRLVLNQQPVKV